MIAPGDDFGLPDFGLTMTYPGGKSGSGTYQAIINLMPPHALYVEPFLGGGAIMRLKRPAAASIGIDADPAVCAQFALEHADEIPGLTLLCRNALPFLADTARAFRADSLVYCDPPYLMHTRRQQRQIYRCEFTDAQHAELLTIIQRLPCMVMISGYWSQLYADALRTWRAVHFPARTRGGSTATEWVWMNFPEPTELHDYRYLGANFRQRQHIKRKVARWQARLARMPALERHALMLALGSAAPEAAMPTWATPEPTIAAGGDPHAPETTMRDPQRPPTPEPALLAAIVSPRLDRGDPGRPGNPGHK